MHGEARACRLGHSGFHTVVLSGLVPEHVVRVDPFVGVTWLHARANFELLSVDHLTEDVVIPHHVPTHSGHVDRRTVVVVVVHAVGDSPVRFLRQIELLRGFIHSLVEGLESLSLSLVDYETFHGLVLLLGVGYFKYRTRLGNRLHTVLLVGVVILLQRWIRKHLVASFVGRGLYV